MSILAELLIFCGMMRKGEKNASAVTDDPVTGQAIGLQVNGRTKDIGVVSRIVFPGTLHDFIVVLRPGDDVDERLDTFLVLCPFRIGKGLAVILITDDYFVSFLSGGHVIRCTANGAGCLLPCNRRLVSC